MPEDKNDTSHYNLEKIKYKAKTNSNELVKLFDNLRWMTSEEAAFYLRKTVGALRTAVCRGQISAKKFHRRLYFKKRDLDLLLENAPTIGGF